MDSEYLNDSCQILRFHHENINPIMAFMVQIQR